MKAPISYALTYPERVRTGVKALDLTELSGLTFFKPDYVRFPALKLAYLALESGESMPAVMNAANEVAVEEFLGGRINFTDIPVVIEKTMGLHQPHQLNSIEEVLLVDRWGRDMCREVAGKMQGHV
jgi:1-deoxy-D-xylulose-5-phosphate reductoisomerase